jgi:hypothetical protein
MGDFNIKYGKLFLTFFDKKCFLIRPIENDLMVYLDMTNIHLLVGSPDEDDLNKALYKLLAAATNTNVKDWATDKTLEASETSS